MWVEVPSRMSGGVEEEVSQEVCSSSSTVKQHEMMGEDVADASHTVNRSRCLSEAVVTLRNGESLFY
jgi:hypothetical protein